MKDFVYQPTKFTKINQISNEKIDIESLTEKIAVFFTDIVGSTEFFKVYGDEHGKEMLHNHYNTASSIINRFNGHVIKFIGDSIMAYFKDPLDALRAAINLQHKIQMHNKQLMALPIRIRIGIHYGNVLVEKKDIYGDVVNVASKLTNMAEGDKIYISNELFNQVKNVPFVHFEMIDSSDKKNIPDGLIVYSVSWDEELILDKENIVFYLSPIPLPNGSAFYEFWENFIKHDDLYLKDRIKKISISKKDTLVFYLKDLSWMFDIARHIMDTLGKKVEDSKEMGIVPVYFLIDNVNDVKNDIALFEEFKKHINPGYIYISEDALIARGSIDVELIKKPPIISGSKKLYRLLYSVEDRRELEPFYFGHILTEGYHSPCFYCGSKKHSPGQCPTKNLPEITEAINKIAYLSTGHINRLFLSLSALKEFQAQGAIVSTVDNEQMIAYTAIFEPTRVFQ